MDKISLDPVMRPTMVIASLAARRHHCETNDILSFDRTRYVMRARYITYWIARNHLGRSQAVIGRLLNREPSAISRGISIVDADDSKIETALAIIREFEALKTRAA